MHTIGCQTRLIGVGFALSLCPLIHLPADLLPGQIVNVDIGPTGGLDGDGGLFQSAYSSVDFDADSQSDVWNHFGQIAGATDFGGLKDIDGAEVPGLTLRAENVSNRSGGFPNTTAAWSNQKGVPNEVMNSIYFRANANNLPLVFTFKGLGTTPVNLEVFSAISTSDFADHAFDIMVNGLFANGSSVFADPLEGDGFLRGGHGSTLGASILFENVLPDGNGWVTLTVLDPATGNPTLNAVRLTASVVPEPAGLGLFLLGFCLLILKRGSGPTAFPRRPGQTPDH